MARARRSFKSDLVGQVPAIMGWLRNSATSGSVASLTDVLLNNPATQGTAASQPTGTTSNGLPVLSFDGTDDRLTWPFASNNNGSPRWGYAAWIRPALVAGVRTILGANLISGASASKLEIQSNNTDLFVNVYVANFTTRRGTASAVLALNTWAFITVEYDGDQLTEPDECIITVNGVKQPLAFANDSGAPNDMPDTLVQPTGTMTIGDHRAASPLTPWNGFIGTNQWILQGTGGISGGGLITSVQREILMRFEAQG